jgi:hypothetical protein
MHCTLHCTLKWTVQKPTMHKKQINVIKQTGLPFRQFESVLLYVWQSAQNWQDTTEDRTETLQETRASGCFKGGKPVYKQPNWPVWPLSFACELLLCMRWFICYNHLPPKGRMSNCADTTTYLRFSNTVFENISVIGHYTAESCPYQ